jgi:hypothetical protein
MPSKECNPMDERLKFIARLLEGEKMAGRQRNRRAHRNTSQCRSPWADLQ